MIYEREEKGENDDLHMVQLYTYKRPRELFESGELVKICAPMVRYSKLQFRQLVRKYGADLVYTPMIMANSFIRASKARDTEFTTNRTDRPLIVQFAASTANEFATAAQFVHPYSDGVDLNCGCPQKWAIQEGVGSAMIDKSALICEMIKETRRRLNYDNNFSISIKIRIHPDIKKTVDLVRQIESAGASYLTIHPRTRFERHEPIHMDALELLATSCTSDMPIVANGDMFKYSDCLKMKEKVSKIRGVMCARGLLENPALFAGYETTPINCIRDWVDICLRDGTPFTYFHQILIYMLQNVLRKSERRCFNTLQTTASVLDFLNENIFDLF